MTTTDTVVGYRNPEDPGQIMISTAIPSSLPVKPS